MEYRARTYDPLTGRFTSVDPLALEDERSKYVYVSNCPSFYLDPFGLKKKEFSVADMSAWNVNYVAKLATKVRVDGDCAARKILCSISSGVYSKLMKEFKYALIKSAIDAFTKAVPAKEYLTKTLKQAMKALVKRYVKEAGLDEVAIGWLSGQLDYMVGKMIKGKIEDELIQDLFKKGIKKTKENILDLLKEKMKKVECVLKIYKCATSSGYAGMQQFGAGNCKCDDGETVLGTLCIDKDSGDALIQFTACDNTATPKKNVTWASVGLEYTATQVLDPLFGYFHLWWDVTEGGYTLKKW
jgi:hypothetical protein